MNLRIFAVAGLTLFSSLAYADSPKPLKILSMNFNSEDVPNDHGAVLRTARLQVVEKQIQEKDPDLIMIQEGWNYKSDASVGETLARDLGYDVAYRVGEGFPFVLFDSNVVLAKKELHMTHETDYKLPHSAGQIGNGKNGIFVLGSITYGVGAKMTFEGEPLYAFTTHLIGETAIDKRDQLLALADQIDQEIIKDGGDPKKAHVIITGDLNSPPTTEAVKGLLARGYIDTLAQMHPVDAATVCSYCGNPNLPWFNPNTIGSKLLPAQTDWTEEARYDYIFIRGDNAKTLAATLTFTAPMSGVWMSDHYAMFSTITFDSALADLKLDSPLRDSTDDTPATIIHLTDGMLKSGKLDLSTLEIGSERGLALVNESTQAIHVAISGPSTIYTAPESDLNPNEGSAFSFLHSGKYSLEIRGKRGFFTHHDRIDATLDVTLGTGDITNSR